MDQDGELTALDHGSIGLIVFYFTVAHSRTAQDGLAQNNNNNSKKRTGKRYLPNRPSCSPDDPIGQATEIN